MEKMKSSGSPRDLQLDERIVPLTVVWSRLYSSVVDKLCGFDSVYNLAVKNCTLSDRHVYSKNILKFPPFIFLWRNHVEI